MGVFFKMDRIPRKEMVCNDKLFRVLSEVWSVLQRKHDRWSAVRAFERVKKDLNVLHKLCKVFLTFFKKEGNDKDGLAVCDGRSVKMFADMIMKSLRDEDFVSGMILKTIYVSFLWGCLHFSIFSWATILRLYIAFCCACRLCFGIGGFINRRS